MARANALREAETFGMVSMLMSGAPRQPTASHEPARFEGRVIAATNRSIAELRRAGTFRDDFYYRLCSDVIHVPTLRQRVEEDPAELDLLLSTILVRIAGEDSEPLRVRIRRALDENLGKDYAWPGNVRELEQCVRRILLTRRCAMDDRLPPAADAGALLLGATNDGAYGADQLLATYCRALYARHKSYEEVARRTKLDRRTVKKYVSV